MGSLYKTSIYFIICLKIVFIILAISHKYFVYKNNVALSDKTYYWKERCEFVFVSSMAILIIYLFYPKRRITSIDYDTKLLLFMFGIVLLITADWATFIGQAKWVHFVQSLVSMH